MITDGQRRARSDARGRRRVRPRPELPSPMSTGQRMSTGAITFLVASAVAFQLPPLPPLRAAGRGRSMPHLSSVTTGGETELLDSLKARKAAVEEGAGRFYRVNALAPGFLNVHSTPGDPWRTDNVVCQLQDGAVVESMREEGVWINHDGGGWSIRVYEGHNFLVPVE